MTAYNVVRFRTKPGMEQTFIDVHKKSHLNAKGFRGGALIKTGERSFCLIGEWAKMDNIAGARPAMIGMLDQFREILEDLGGGLGVTDPVSGSVVADIKAPRKKAKKASKKRGKKNRKR